MTSVFAGATDPQGPAAREIADLWWFMLILGTAVFVLFMVLLVLASRRRGDEAEPGVETQQSAWWLYGGGVVLPVVGIGAVLVATLVVMQGNPETVAADENGAARSAGSEGAPVVVEAVASQFWWEFRYPGEDVVTATELHIPAGEPVQLRIEATDVIHSFWVPDLAGKRDALPGNTTFLVIEADEPGRFRGSCAEFCGLGHALMEVQVVAHDRPGYEAWLASARQPAAEPVSADAEQGQRLFLEHCAECHTVRGTPADGDDGPDLTHFASRRTIGSGALERSAENLRRWIHEPEEVKAGVQMPPSDLPPEDVAAIVAYLEGLTLREADS